MAFEWVSKQNSRSFFLPLLSVNLPKIHLYIQLHHAWIWIHLWFAGFHLFYVSFSIFLTAATTKRCPTLGLILLCRTQEVLGLCSRSCSFPSFKTGSAPRANDRPSWRATSCSTGVFGEIRPLFSASFPTAQTGSGLFFERNASWLNADSAIITVSRKKNK